MATNRAIRRNDEMAYREHNVTRVSEKMVPDIEGRATPQARPNNPDQQCQCDACKAHRRRNGMTGVAGPNRSIS